MARSYVRQNVVNMARSYVRQNVVNFFELQPRSGERSYDILLQPRSGERSYVSL